MLNVKTQGKVILLLLLLFTSEKHSKVLLPIRIYTTKKLKLTNFGKYWGNEELMHLM